MEVTGQAFEDMQEQNMRLLQQLKEKDDANFKLMSEVRKKSHVRGKGNNFLFELKEDFMNLCQRWREKLLVRVKERDFMLEIKGVKSLYINEGENMPGVKVENKCQR